MLEFASAESCYEALARLDSYTRVHSVFLIKISSKITCRPYLEFRVQDSVYVPLVKVHHK